MLYLVFMLSDVDLDDAARLTWWLKLSTCGHVSQPMSSKSTSESINTESNVPLHLSEDHRCQQHMPKTVSHCAEVHVISISSEFSVLSALFLLIYLVFTTLYIFMIKLSKTNTWHFNFKELQLIVNKFPSDFHQESTYKVLS